MPQHSINTSIKGRQFLRIQVSIQFSSESTIQLTLHVLNICDQRLWNFFAYKIPHYGSQFGFGMEADPMIDQPQFSAAIQQNMSAFAIRVVHNEIEQRHRAQTLARRRVEREIMLHGVMVHTQLHAAWTQRPILAKYRWRHQFPAQRFAHQIRGHLAARQCFSREIP